MTEETVKGRPQDVARGWLSSRARKFFLASAELTIAEEALEVAQVDAREAGLSQAEIDRIIARQRLTSQ